MDFDPAVWAKVEELIESEIEKADFILQGTRQK
jgi:hypothetical protein